MNRQRTLVIVFGAASIALMAATTMIDQLRIITIPAPAGIVLLGASGVPTGRRRSRHLQPRT